MIDQRSNTAQVHMYLLRPFRIVQNGNPVHLPTRRTESLLGYLVLHPSSHSREKLAALFWADSSETSARGSLRKALTFIRKHLGSEVILTDREQIQLNPGFDLYCDAAEFERQGSRFLAVLNPDIHEMDFELYQNELLTDFYDDWILEEREHYHQLYIKLMLRAIEVLRAQSEYSTAIQYARKLLIRESTNEQAYQHLIFCHIALGDRHGALQQYEACRKVLETELGVKPARETRALYEWITQSSDIRSLAARVTNLPIPISSFVGRQRELAEIKRLLSAARLITLTGVGGSGKTRLAIRAATELLDSFDDGVWWVDFSSLSNPALVPQSVAKCLGVIESAPQGLIESIIAAIQEKEMLLVLDNCEHLVEACAQLVNSLLTQCPRLKVLATSREALRVDGEVVFRVPTLLVPNIDRISIAELLLDYESVKLFVTRARAVQNNFVVDDRTAVFLAQICARLDGIPLAIELAAARVKTISVEQITENLDDVFRLLTGGSRTALPRQQTLRAMIDWSYDLLSEEEQEVFRCLSVFAGGWTLEAGEAVCNKSNMLDLLVHLVDKSLVAVDFEYGNEPRYYFLETIRQYAREKLWVAGEGEVLRQRHLAYFVDLAERAEPNLRAFDVVMWLDRLEIELDNIRLALEWALESDIEAQLRLASALLWFCHIRGHINEGIDWWARGLSVEASKRGNQPITLSRALIRGKVLNAIGIEIDVSSDDSDRAKTYLEESVELFRELGSVGKQGLTYALTWLAGYESQSRSIQEQNLTVFREIGDKFGAAECLMFLNQAARNNKEYERARTLAEEHLALRREIGDQDGAAFALMQLGQSAFLQHDYRRAVLLLEESLSIFRAVGNKPAIGLGLSNLGDVFFWQRNYDQATKIYEEALAFALDISDRFWIALHSSNLGTIAWFQGDYARANEMIAESLAVFRDQHQDWLTASCMHTLGDIALAQGDEQRAIQWYERELAFGQEKQLEISLMFALSGSGRAAWVQGNGELATKRFEEALRVSEKASSKAAILLALYGLGRVALSQSDYDSSHEFLTQASRIKLPEDIELFGWLSLKPYGVATAYPLEAFAVLAAAQHQMERAAQLFGAVESLYPSIHSEMSAKERAEHDYAIASARAALNDEVFAVAWAEGAAMDMKQAVEYALSSRSR